MTDGDRDLVAELESAEAGYNGMPVDARCTGCQQVRVKRVSPEDVDQHPQIDPATLEARDLTSFKHVCHRCQTATWWNPMAVLSGLIEREGENDGA